MELKTKFGKIRLFTNDENTIRLYTDPPTNGELFEGLLLLRSIPYHYSTSAHRTPDGFKVNRGYNEAYIRRRDRIKDDVPSDSAKKALHDAVDVALAEWVAKNEQAIRLAGDDSRVNAIKRKTDELNEAYRQVDALKLELQELEKILQDYRK